MTEGGCSISLIRKKCISAQVLRAVVTLMLVAALARAVLPYGLAIEVRQEGLVALSLAAAAAVVGGAAPA